MKQFFFRVTLILFTFAVLVSCKKDHDSSYYFKFKLNGNWVNLEHTVGVLKPDDSDPGKTYLFVAGSDEGKESFDIEMFINGSVTTGTFETTSNAYDLEMYYGKGAEPNIQFFDAADGPGQSPSKYILNITSSTDKEIRGNFSGNYMTDTSTDEMVSITEGEFVVHRIHQ